MANILVICPTGRDIRELNRLTIDSPHNLIFYGDNPRNYLDTFDVLTFINEAIKKFTNENIDGIIGTHDYPGSIIAAIMAKSLHLPTVDLDKILVCQHKYCSREAQRKVVPDSVPKFKLVNPYEGNNDIPLPFPFFIKPVKSFLSIFATMITNEKQYNQFIDLAKPHLSRFVNPFNQLLKKYGHFRLDACHLIAEELLKGQQVTVEGCSYDKKVEIIGIVDSIMYPNTISFQRFEYPSTLPPKILERMEQIAKDCIMGIGFNGGLFNIEMFYNAEHNTIHIIEINPRMSSQFADLIEKVNGQNTYEIQIALALGEPPTVLRNEGKDTIAVSFVLRTFHDKTIQHFPSQDEVSLILQQYPDARIEIYGKEGMRLSHELNDMESYRYGIINLGGKDKEDLLQKFNEVKQHLQFAFLKTS